MLLNRAKASTATTGTGAVTLGAAVSPYQSWSAAGAASGIYYDYLIEDGVSWEVGTGLYNGTTVTRPGPGTDTNFASSSGALLNLSGSATIACVANKNSSPNFNCGNGLLLPRPPDPSTFTLSGSNPVGTTTSFVPDSYFNVTMPQGAASSAKYMKALPGSTPWTIYCAVSLQADATQGTDFGISLYTAANAMLRHVRMTMITGGQWRFGVSNAGGDLFTQTGVQSYLAGIPTFFRIKNDGTNVKYGISTDYGLSWFDAVSEVIANISTATQYGFDMAQAATGRQFASTIWSLYTV